MSSQLVDFAGVVAAANRHAAEGILQVLRGVEKLPLPDSGSEPMRNGAALTAQLTKQHAATELKIATARAEEYLEMWKLIVESMQSSIAPETQLELLQTYFKAGVAVRINLDDAERLSQFNRGETTEDCTMERDPARSLSKSVDRAILDIRRTIQEQSGPWKPRDPERFAQGLRDVAEGRTISSEALIARYRQSSK